MDLPPIGNERINQAEHSENVIRFRPHHFFCALGFEGKGYSDTFTANMAKIINGRLRAEDGDEAVIEVVDTTDDICGPCPSRIGRLCVSQKKIDRLDAAHAEALQLVAGERLSWGAAKARMAAQPNDIHQDICAGCQWLPMGMCAASLQRLKAETES